MTARVGAGHIEGGIDSVLEDEPVGLAGKNVPASHVTTRVDARGGCEAGSRELNVGELTVLPDKSTAGLGVLPIADYDALRVDRQSAVERRVRAVDDNHGAMFRYQEAVDHIISVGESAHNVTASVDALNGSNRSSRHVDLGAHACGAGLVAHQINHLCRCES